MEIIGDPRSFAVELAWDGDTSLFKPWMYGAFCVYICGERLGSPTNQVTLNAVLAELDGWKEWLPKGSRDRPDLMNTDPLHTFLSIESEAYGLDHLKDKIPPDFTPYSVPPTSGHQILSVDGLEDYKIYCVEDDTTSRILYALSENVPPKECRVPRAELTDVLLRTIDRLDEWFSQLPEPPTQSNK